MDKQGSRRAARGFTLLEMLVVLLLMGICVGLVSVVAQPGPGAVLDAEANRLARLLELAADESRLTGKPIAWTADATGYRFWQSATQGEWSLVRDNAMLRERVLPAGLVLELRVENAPIPGPLRVEFTPDAATFAYAIDLSLGSSRLVVASSPVGEIRVVAAAGGPADGIAPR